MGSVQDAIKKRRAYRSLAPVTITPELVSDLATAASLAPSCFNKQPWRFVFVAGEQQLANVLGTLSAANRDWAQAASLIIAVISGVELDCRLPGRDYYLFDTGLATAQLILRATELGLVAHPIAGYDEVKAKEILAIPTELTVITLLIVGQYTAVPNLAFTEKQREMEENRPERMALPQFAFIDRYPNAKQNEN